MATNNRNVDNALTLARERVYAWLEKFSAQQSSGYSDATAAVMLDNLDPLVKQNLEQLAPGALSNLQSRVEKGKKPHGPLS